MRHARFLFTLAVLLGATGLLLARVTLTVKTIGFGGYYRPRTVVPIVVQVKNSADTVSGEFQVSAPGDNGALRDSYRTRVTLPKGANQLHFLYFIPRGFIHDLEVRFVANGAAPVSSVFRRCQELYEVDRLLVVVGGTGSSLNYVNGQLVSVPEYPMPRPWDVTSDMSQRYGRPPYGGRLYGSGASGTIRLVYSDSTLLPDNPEAYGSVSMLALMADVTENTLKSGAQEAIPLWVASGGHLLVAGSAVTSRLDAPFFQQFLAAPAGSSQPFSEERTNISGGKAQVRRFGAGHVSLLNYDPDMAPGASDWRKLSAFYGKLLAQNEAEIPVTGLLRDAISTAVMVRNLKPPNLRLIVIFLLIYLVMLVPINYFVLKKLDKRELAWVTTPVIVLIFTFGAYGIGYITKGHRLVTNVVTLVETVAGQTSAEAISQLLIFSPSRTRYQVNLGTRALAAREFGAWDDGSGDPRERGEALYYHDTNTGLLLERLQVNMWAFRQLTMAHQLDLGKGFRGSFTVTPSRTPPRYGTPTPSATFGNGKVTNGTPYDFALCELYYNGSWVASFPTKAGQTVDVKTASASPNLKLDEQGQHMLDSMRNQVKSRLIGTQRMHDGFVLVGYSADPKARVGLKISDRQPTGAMTVVVTHL